MIYFANGFRIGECQAPLLKLCRLKAGARDRREILKEDYP